MRYYDELLLSAASLLHENCNIREFCDGCIFYNREGLQGSTCKIAGRDTTTDFLLYPDDWKIEEDQ